VPLAPTRPAAPAARLDFDRTGPLPPRLLAAIAVDYASTSLLPAIDTPRSGERAFERVHLAPGYDIWLIEWGAGSGTVLHDHGGSTGALVVVAGALVEHVPNPAGVGRILRHELRAPHSRAMSATHVHAVVNETGEIATSIHAYSPPLSSMQHYDATNGGTRAQYREIVDPGTLGPA
jgi:Cysteine dioxygenase type I